MRGASPGATGRPASRVEHAPTAGASAAAGRALRARGRSAAHQPRRLHASRRSRCRAKRWSYSTRRRRPMELSAAARSARGLRRSRAPRARRAPQLRRPPRRRLVRSSLGQRTQRPAWCRKRPWRCSTSCSRAPAPSGIRHGRSRSSPVGRSTPRSWTASSTTASSSWAGRFSTSIAWCMRWRRNPRNTSARHSHATRGARHTSGSMRSSRGRSASTDGGARGAIRDRVRVTERILTLRELNRATLARQLLLERKRLSPTAVIERLVGMQAQWPPAPYIGIWTRTTSFRRAALERELARAAVVKATVMRQTLHLVTRRDYALLRAAFAETNHYDKMPDAELLAPFVRALASAGP